MLYAEIIACIWISENKSIRNQTDEDQVSK
jgi:hypothetical protein